MTQILLNAKLVSSADGYVRRINLEFFLGNRHKNFPVSLLPGMSREEVANSLRKSATELEEGCGTDYTESKHQISAQAS